MTLGDAAQRPWMLAAVCLMVLAITLLLFGPPRESVLDLLPGYVAAYLLIGACVFGPARKLPSLRQALAFLLPGSLLAPLALLDLGFWAGGWLLGLPAWGLLLSGRTAQSPLPLVQILQFLCLLVLGLAIFTFNAIYPVFGLGLYLLPLVALGQLADPEYRSRPLQAAVEGLLSVAAVATALAIPTPEGSWTSPWTYAGGASTVGLMIAFWAKGIRFRSRRLRLNDGAVV